MWKPVCNRKRLARIHPLQIVIWYMEDKTQEKESFEIDAFDLMNGKMSSIALERMHRQVSSRTP